MKYPGDTYDNANVDTLQAALNSACEELGVSNDHKKCEAVALLERFECS